MKVNLLRHNTLQYIIWGCVVVKKGITRLKNTCHNVLGKDQICVFERLPKLNP